jgi:alkylation response protein AidB-like acyl-CoA dehydrogenase
LDFRFDEEQTALRDVVHAVCARTFDLANVQSRQEPTARAAAWRALVDLGLFGFLVSGEDGGAVEAAIVLEQLGAHLVSGPALWSTIAAPLIPGVQLGAVAVTGVEATPATEPILVEHVAESGIVVVLYEDRVERCEAQELGDGRYGQPLDPLTPAASFDVLPRGDVIGNETDARRLRLTGTVLASAMLVGVAQGALDVASSYALERQQFGVAIGSFQAVKHLLADMYVRTELARSAAYAAAALYHDPRAGDADKAASIAKLLAGEAGIANGRAAVQVLGGMGFTWETLPHYYLKRAWVLEQSFGTGDAHAVELADALTSEKLWT